MDSKARRQLGEDTYRSVMQTEPPEVRSVLTAKMLDLEFAELWNRELLTRKERRWITLACLAAQSDEILTRAHVYGALKSGDISLEELQEGIFHLALYRGCLGRGSSSGRCGTWPTSSAWSPTTDALDLEAIDWASESDRLDVGEQKYLSVMAGRVTRGAGAYPHQGVIQTVFAELWPRGVITQRERRLITLACVGLSYAPLPITMHCQVAMETGDVSFRELEELNLHMAFYAGWPCTSSMTAATSVALQTLKAQDTAAELRRDIQAAHEAVGPDYSVLGYRVE